MSIIQTLKKSASLIVFVAMVIGVFWLMQKKVTDNIMYCTLISILVAIALTYFQSKFIADALEQSESAKKAKMEVKSLRSQQIRLRKKFKNSQLNWKLRI